MRAVSQRPYSDTPVDVLLTALVGLAGILAAFFAPTWTDRRIARRREAQDLLQARRLVAQELETLAIQLRTVARQGRAFLPELADFFETDEWEAHKATLARSLDGTQWRALASVYGQIASLRSALALSGEHEPGEQLNTVLREAVRVGARLAVRARTLLDPEQDYEPLPLDEEDDEGSSRRNDDGE